MSVSIEALAMAGADYLECNVVFEEHEHCDYSALAPPHLLADDQEEMEGEEFWWKMQIIKRSIPATSHQSVDVHCQPEGDRADHMENEGDLIKTINVSGRKVQEDVADLSKLLSKLSFTTFFKEKLEAAVPACQDKGGIYISGSWP